MDVSVETWVDTKAEEFIRAGATPATVLEICTNRGARLLGKPLNFRPEDIEKVNKDMARANKDTSEASRFKPEYCEPGGKCDGCGCYGNGTPVRTPVRCPLYIRFFREL